MKGGGNFVARGAHAAARSWLRMEWRTDGQLASPSAAPTN